MKHTDKVSMLAHKFNNVWNWLKAGNCKNVFTLRNKAVISADVTDGGDMLTITCGNGNTHRRSKWAIQSDFVNHFNARNKVPTMNEVQGDARYSFAIFNHYNDNIAMVLRS
jgi:hypothetical protein